MGGVFYLLRLFAALAMAIITACVAAGKIGKVNEPATKSGAIGVTEMVGVLESFDHLTIELAGILNSISPSP